MPSLLSRNAIAVLAVIVAGSVLAVSTSATSLRFSEVRLSGGSPAQQALMRQILDRMRPDLIATVSLTPPPKSLGDWPRAPTYLAVTSKGGIKGAGEWQAWMFQGAFGDLSSKHHLPQMFRFAPLTAPPGGTAAGAAALTTSVHQDVARTAGGSDVAIVSLQVTRPDGLAVSLVLRSSNPAAYMKNDLRNLLQLVRGGKPELDGTYLALEDTTGSVVWTAYQSARMGSGADYVRPDLAACNPILNLGGPLGSSPPPCPA